MQDRKIWLRGQIVPASQATVNVLSPTAQFGLNVFEGIRCYWDHDERQLNGFRLQDHFVRLLESCRLIGIESPYTTDQLLAYLREVIAANHYQADIAVRMTMFVDNEGTWSSCSPVNMFIAPILKARIDISKWKGLSACISSWERIHDNCLPPRIKVGANYINGRYGHLQAQRDGYDVPIFLGRDGKVTEGAGACLFMLRRGEFITPTLTSSVLESITRDTVIKMGKDISIRVRERPIDRTELYLADEIFFCGSAVEISPIISVDGFKVGNGKPGEVTTSLLRRYHDIVTNRDTIYSHWNTRIYADNEASV